jgi:iron complex transport system substrate-binding protein
MIFLGFLARSVLVRKALVICVFSLLLCICNCDQPKANTVHSVVDRRGDTVVIPDTIEKILVTCYGGASHEIAMLGAADKIVAHPPMNMFPLFTRIYPVLSDKPNAGSFNDINMEYIMILNPDLVVASVTSEQANERIKKLMGIPLVTVGTGRTTVELLLNEFAMMGKILGAEQDAAEVIAYWREKLEMISERTRNLPLEKKRTVYYCSSGTPLKTEGSFGWGQNYIEVSGGINVSSAIKVTATVSPEQLLLWDPDVIITGSRKIKAPGNDMQRIMSLTSLKAVKNNEVYYCPIGAFWWDRPSMEAILGIQWLAKNLYPDLMADIDIEKETKEFYKRFYKYNLTDQEYLSIYETVLQQNKPVRNITKRMEK